MNAPIEGVIRKHHPDRLILICTLLLMFVGLLVIYAIGPQRANFMNTSLGYGYSDGYFFQKQLISFVLALGVFFVMTKIPYEWVFKHGFKVLMAGFVACALLAVAAKVGVIDETLGAARWIPLGPLGSVQPAEIVKLGLLLYGAVFLGIRAREGKINDLKATLIPIGALTFVGILFIIIIQKDLGTGIALTSIVATMLVMAGISKKLIFWLFGILIVFGIILIFSAPHRMERVATYLQGGGR